MGLHLYIICIGAMTHTHNISKKYGWKKDKTDVRDKFLRYGVVDLNGLPSKVDLRDKCSPIEDQTTLGSCTANAAAGALEYLENKLGNTPKFENFSRLFIYYNTRILEGTVTEDSGASLRNVVKAVVKAGACDESIWSYNPDKFNQRPPLSCYRDGRPHRITEYHRLDSLPDMLKCLSEGFPFILGFSVYSSFEGSEVASTGILNLPAPNEECLGGHAVCAVGYDMDSKRILIRNSWGSGWGQSGHFTMPFDYISNPNLASDFWTLRK